MNCDTVHVAHHTAKKLNNSAAYCIETGQHKRAVTFLLEALQLSDECIAEAEEKASGPSFYCCYNSYQVCQCTSCSLDECIVYSDETSLLNDKEEHLLKNNADNDEANSVGYIHRRPIRITPQSLHEGHYMGCTLSLIITFNLALAHHLNVVDSKRTQTCKETFQKILHLYELVYKCQIELEDRRFVQQLCHNNNNNNNNKFGSAFSCCSSDVTSLRFHMIIFNNSSQIHRLVKNHTKQRRCLEHLLATLMYRLVVENDDHFRGTKHRQHHHEKEHLDGFLSNAASIILRRHCAGAA
jgi:hypothetical protein